MNIVLAAVSSKGKVIFELVDEERIERSAALRASEDVIHVKIRPKAYINDMHDMSYPVFLEILHQVEEESARKFGEGFRLVKFVFFGFSRC